VEREPSLTAGRLTARRILFLIAAICVATVSYLFLLAWAIAYAALSQAPPWWRTMIPSTKAASLSWLWLSHALAVVLVTIPIAFALRFCIARRRLVAAFSVSVVSISGHGAARHAPVLCEATTLRCNLDDLGAGAADWSIADYCVDHRRIGSSA
jgi:hypothetical protein